MIVYAVGESGNLEFHLAEDSNAIPQTSPIYAKCDGKRCDCDLDQYSVRTMSDGEYYELQATIRLAQRLEAQRLQRPRNGHIFHQLLRWLSQLPARAIPGRAPMIKRSYIDISNPSS